MANGKLRKILMYENRPSRVGSRSVTAQVRPIMAEIGKHSYDKLRLSAYFSSMVSYLNSGYKTASFSYKIIIPYFA